MSRAAAVRGSLRMGGGIIAVLLLVIWLGAEDLALGIARLGMPLLLALVALQALTFLLLGAHWHLLLRRLGAVNSYLDQVAVTLAATFVESVTPSVKLGGEAARFYLLRRRTGLDAPSLGGAFLAHTAMSLFPLSLLLVTILGGAVWQGVIPTAFIPALGLAVVLGGALYRLGTTSGASVAGEEAHANWIQRAVAFCRRARRESAEVLDSPTRVSLMLLALLVWLLYPLKVMLVSFGLDTPVGFFPAAAALFGAYLVGLLPLLPGGLGTFEATLAGLLTLFGMTPDQGLLVALLTRLVTFWFPLLLSALAAAYVFLGPEPAGSEKKPGASCRAGTAAGLCSRVTGWGEYGLARAPALGQVYCRLFYRRLLKRESGLAGLRPGDRVLHVGCGAMPMTALALARQGLRVVALDVDPEAARRARAVTERSGCADMVEVRLGDGRELDASGFQGVWVSFHAQPRQEILQGLLETMDQGARLVFRNSRDWLCRFYPAVEPRQLPPNRVIGRLREGLGKEIVVLQRLAAPKSADGAGAEPLRMAG